MKLFILFALVVVITCYAAMATEGFTTYSLNYETTIEPKRFPNIAAPKDYRRCVCSSDGECRCIYDSQLDFTSDFPELYFDEYPLYY
jgi:hypothetical protein